MRYGLRVNTYIREDARRYVHGASPDELVRALAATSYESRPFARWHPVAAVPLSEVILHGQDIRVRSESSERSTSTGSSLSRTC